MSETSHPEPRIADALPDHWADRLLPGALRPYARLMRLERPIGWWLLLLPCWWGLTLGQIAQGGGVPNLWYAALFLIGAIIMRGAGCTLNDIADRNFDGRVERTRLRPIPAGQVSVTQALAFLVLLCLLGLAVLLQFNGFTVATGAASLLIVAVYPFMKRITYWPQAVLGLAFNWGALVGWAATHGSLSLAPLLLYAGGISWTLAYDTIYAHQDKEDDALIGVKSTALKFGDKSIRWLALFFTLAIVLIDAAAWVAGAGLIAHIGVAAAALQAAWQLARFEPDNGARCLELFRSNRIFGLIITSGFLLDSLLT
ncbi:MAG: 4-hydroxybenzoate octaprenyltransferase [Aestuariivirga sp.]|uniref:4-hydroxybenzoate octaprenyltransferase n=1 Tax=Aestuariivirga sp. TaxID=2650926 RepID=UPI0034595D62|nr:4-hydroxybenzoate octaprenyltransferase [Aestuariivirga sp.]